MEEHVPRAPWRRRRTTDSPRPGGRRWAGRLRRSGTLARQAITVRVGRRRTESSRAATAVRSEVLYTGSDVLPSRPATEGRLIGPAVESLPAVPTPPPAPSLLPGAHPVPRRGTFSRAQARTPPP